MSVVFFVIMITAFFTGLARTDCKTMLYVARRSKCLCITVIERLDGNQTESVVIQLAISYFCNESVIGWVTRVVVEQWPLLVDGASRMFTLQWRN